MSSNTTPTAAPQPPTGQRYRVLLSQGPSVRTQVLSGSRWTVGRSDDCDLQLRDPTVAPLQVVFEAAGDTLAFRDLTSTGRVLLDGRRCRDGRLPTGSTLLIGTTRLTAEPLGRSHRITPTRTLRNLPWLRARQTAPAPSAPFDSSWLEALQPLLQPFTTEDPVHAARIALEAGMDSLGRDLGLLARIEGDHLTVLASVSRRPSAAELRASPSLLRKARAARAGTSVRPGTRRDQLLVPIGDGAGLMVLAAARPDAPPPAACQVLAPIAGEIVWLRVQQAEALGECRDELARRRLAPDRSPLISTRRLDSLRAQLRRVARQRLPVMLVGERGTEKQDLARYLHANSERAAEPFVTMHAGLTPAEEQGAELLGTPRSVAGAVQRAGSGTLFLEEPEALTPQLQERLVRLLRRRALACRLVCASTQSPEEAARNGQLRLDLASKLAATRLQVPPLRSNRADILTLAECILGDLAGGDDSRRRTLSEAAAHCLLQYPWPGNVDELHNVLAAAVAQSDSNVIGPRLLPIEVRCPPATNDDGLPTLTALENRYIQQVLELFNRNKRAAAKALGIATSTLYEKLKRMESDAE